MDPKAADRAMRQVEILQVYAIPRLCPQLPRASAGRPRQKAFIFSSFNRFGHV